MSIVDKPQEESNTSKACSFHGLYMIIPVLNQMKPTLNGELQLTDALNILAKKGKVIAYKFKGKRFDCGGTEGFLEANNYLSKFI